MPNKQAIMRYLKGQELADLTIAYVYGGARDKPVAEREAEAKKRGQEVSVEVTDDYILIKGDGSEGCAWVDSLIDIDNQKGRDERKMIEATIREKTAEAQARLITDSEVESDA